MSGSRSVWCRRAFVRLAGCPVIAILVSYPVLSGSHARAQGFCFENAVNYAADSTPISVSAADLDGDGDQDLAVVNANSANVSVLKNNGDGTYASAVNYAVGSYPVSVSAADLDGDGDQDLAVALDNDGGSVSVLRNNGGGTFALGGDYIAGSDPMSVFAADLDEDDDRDLAVANFGSNNVTVLKNNGDGTYAPAINYTAGYSPISVFAADLNGDGERDLAVANWNSANVSVLKNNGDGTYAAAVNYAVGTRPMSVFASDLDGDGDQDLVVADGQTANVSVLKNNGDGTYTSAVNYAAGTGPRSVFASDLDGDGDEDLAVANEGSDNISVLNNNGDGTYATTVDYAVGTGPVSVFAADLDGDGDQDLAVANWDSGDVSVLKNCGTTCDGFDGASVDLAMWNPVSGDWVQQDGMVTGYWDPGQAQSDQGNLLLVDALQPTGDYAFEAEMVVKTVGQNENHWKFVLYNSVGNKYNINYDVEGQAVGTEVRQGGGNYGPPHYGVTGVPYFNTTVGAVNYARLFRRGSVFSLYLNEHFLFSFTELIWSGNVKMGLGVYGHATYARACVTSVTFPTVLTVTNLADFGPGSLREAISDANYYPGRDSIIFSVAGVIHPSLPIPSLQDPGGVVIDGLSAPGATPGDPTVILDGSGAPVGAGIVILASNNLIRGLEIRNFTGSGILIEGAGAVQNTISGNRIYGNGQLGIDLGADGVTPNDPGDTDTGPNDLVNYPVFDSVFEVPPDSFALFGRAPRLSRIEVFLAAKAGNPSLQPEATRHGPAYRFIGSNSASPIGTFIFFVFGEPEWSQITATATDSVGNTSEFAQNKLLTPDPLRITGYSEPVPPLRGVMSLPLGSPALQVIVNSPPDSVGHVDSIGPSFNTFGPRATYDSLTDHNSGGIVDTRVKIVSPDSGEYQIKYVLIGDPGNYLTGIGIDGHAEVKHAVAFAGPGQVVDTTYHLAPPTRGELNGDGVIDVFDVIASIDIVFSGAPMPDPPELVDVNCDGVPDVFDVIYLIDYAFSGGAQPCR
jgi:hypothetical protein